MGNPISYRQEVFRKLIHLSSLWMVAAILLLEPYRFWLGAAFAVAWLLNLILEHLVAQKTPVLTPLYRFFFGRMLREEPHPGQWVISGSPPVWAAAALVTLLFPTVAAATALATMLTADTAAALIGRKFGRHKTVNGKSLEGVAAFLLTGWLCVALISLRYRIDLPVYFLCGGVGVALAAAAELFEKQLHVDDNFSIPLITGAALTCGMYLGGLL